MDWKKWRSEGIGASDAPIILGVSPWKTRYQLWEEKSGLVTRDISNWATERGNELEPKARANYELTTGLDMPVAFVEHKDLPFIRASLDGWNPDANVVLEIKCPGAEDHAKAVSGQIPAKYIPQVQHQLFVTGAKRVDYYSFDGDQSFALVQVFPDVPYIKAMVAELVKFWGQVKTGTPPEFSDKDVVEVKDGDVLRLAEAWSVAKGLAEDAAADLEKARQALIAGLGTDPHPKVLVGSVTLTRSTRVGAVDYKKVPALEGVDLDQYRGKASTSWTIKEKKG